jgi:hypothetical protein
VLGGLCPAAVGTVGIFRARVSKGLSVARSRWPAEPEPGDEEDVHADQPHDLLGGLAEMDGEGSAEG